MFPSLILRNTARAAAGANPGKKALDAGAKRDPELYLLGAITVVALGGAGYFFGRSPTGSDAEDPMAWHGSNPNKGYEDRKDAPSALHSVTVPNVNLPKELHERFNKYGKSEY